ncbi:hypothetical protein V1511DRAFT_521661 [Dipodascopsis uninucleata]
MSWFSSSSVIDEQVERATSLSLPNGEVDLALNLEICDLIRSKTVPAKEAMRSLKKRLNHKNPNVQILALKLVDTCVKNGGFHFLVEIASREFMDNLVSILKNPTGVNPDVKTQMLELIQTWSSVFEGQMQLAYVTTIYNELKKEGFEFPSKPTQVSTTFIDSSAPPDWIDSDVCMRCRTPFSFTNRKHHCRNCGKVFDQNCSSKSIPLPHLGITQPVRVCDTCYAEKNPAPVKHHSSHSRSKSSDEHHRRKIPEDDDDAELQRVLKMSLEESSQPASASYTPAKAVPPAPTLKSVSANDEDPEIKEAIAASLRDMEEQKRAKQQTSNGVNMTSTQDYPQAPTSVSGDIQPPLPVVHSSVESPIQTFSSQLSIPEIDNINLFSILVNHMQNEPPSAILRDPKLQELYDKVTSLRPKLSRNVAESVGKYDALLDMYSKLSAAVRYYDQILEARLGYTYGSNY